MGANAEDRITNMSSPPLDINLTTLEHAHMCLYEAFLLSQPSLSEALLLVVPANDIRSLLDSRMRQHFVNVPQVCAAHCCTNESL